MTTTDPDKLKAKRLRKVERQKASGVYQAKQKRKYGRRKTSETGIARQKRRNASPARRAHEQRRNERKAMARPFISWDGEGITVCKVCRAPWDEKWQRCSKCAYIGGSEHIYILLRNSTGTSIRGTAGHPLNTRACINLILHTAFLNPGAIHVAYAFDYDVNMILADCTEDDLRLIHDYDGNAGVFTRSAGAVVNYRPHKMTRFSRTINGKRYSCTIFDLFTFEHRSFVKACDRYLGNDWPHRDEVMAGKEGRSSFTIEQIDDIDRYCGYELDAMVLFANELRSRLDDAGLRPSTWNGPGAVASRVLTKHNIKAHMPAMGQDRALDLTSSPMAYAYTGGRFELFRYGVMDEPVWRYDIHSAYPWAMTLLPSLAGGRWHHFSGASWAQKRTNYYIQPYSLYHVHWRSRQTDGSRPQPFHHRHPNGNVCYPYETEGWYWSPEVEMALRYAALDGHCDIQIKEAYIFEPANDERPFSFMEDYYQERAALKAAGHPAELAYKLAINSVYGKLIQQLGWNKETGKQPPWFCLQWGGLITSYTRAALMNTVIGNRGLDDLISFETDAIFSRRPLENIDIGDKLGAWEDTRLDSLTYLQSGFYAGTIDGEPFGKMRGRTADTVNAAEPVSFGDEIAQCILERRPYKYTLHGFMGMGRALGGDFSQWRKWVDMPREVEPPDILVETSSKRVHDILHCVCDDGRPTMAGMWHTTFVPPILSTGLQRPYEIAWEGRTPRDELWEDI